MDFQYAMGSAALGIPPEDDLFNDSGFFDSTVSTNNKPVESPINFNGIKKLYKVTSEIGSEKISKLVLFEEGSKYNLFLQECKKKFSIEPHADIILFIDFFQIEEEDFPIFIRDNPDGHFIIKRKFEKNPTVTPSDGEVIAAIGNVTTLTSYFTLKNIEYEKFQASGEKLNDTKRKLLVNSSVDFMIYRHGYYPTTDQKVEIAKQLSKLFPELKQEALFDPKTGDGFLEWRLKYARKIKKAQDASLNLTGNAEAVVVVPLKPVTDPETVKSYLLEPEKIIDWFKSRFSDDDQEAVQRKWILINQNIDEALKLKSAIIPIEWDDEFMMTLSKLVQVLPSSNRTKKNKTKSSEALNSLFVFRKLNTPMKETTNYLERLQINQPVLLVSGQDKTSDLSFNVIVDKIVVRESASAYEAFDLLFKSHFVFDLKYCPILLSFYQFIQKYVYEFDHVKIKGTPRMKQLNGILFEKVKTNGELNVEKNINENLAMETD